MDFFDKVANAAKDAAHAVSQTTGDLVDKGKLKLAIGKAKGDRKDLYTELGELTYRAHKGETDADARTAEIFTKLAELEEEIARLEAEENESKEEQPTAAERCPKCGAARVGDAPFCGQCGAKF